MNVIKTVASEFILPLAAQHACQLRYVCLLDQEAALGLSAAARAVPEHGRYLRLVTSDLETFDAGPVGFLPHDEFAACFDPVFDDRSCLLVVHVVSSRTKYTETTTGSVRP